MAKREMTMSQLAELADMGANNLHRVMSPDYGKQTISSLKRIAEALDVALVVRMIPFSQYVDWLSGTPRVDKGLRPDALAVPSFEDEERLGAFENHVQIFEVVNGRRERDQAVNQMTFSETEKSNVKIARYPPSALAEESRSLVGVA
jgi:transcriptional regulator with XRE-family HTH domain